MSRERTKTQMRRMKLRSVRDHTIFFGSTGKDPGVQIHEIGLVQFTIIYWGLQGVVLSLVGLFWGSFRTSGFTWICYFIPIGILLWRLYRSYLRHPIHPVPRPR